MISESQAEYLLSQCETWLGAKLHKLRWRLRSEHEQTKSHLWELIVLHATASAVISRHRSRGEANSEVSSLIQPEGEKTSVPDIFLQPDDCEPFWVEVTYITPHNPQQETDIICFPSWMRDELSKGRVADSQHLRIGLKPADTSKDVQVPPNNSWRQLLKTDKWKLNAIGTATLPGTKAPRQRVKSSRLISAVVIVTIKNEYSGFYGLRKRASRPIVIKNPHPDVELTAQQEQLLHQINLNQVEYGSGCESWETQKQQKNSVALQRYKEREGRFVFSPGANLSFDVEIPCNLVALFLAEDITASEVWDDQKSGSDDYPTLKKQIGDSLRFATELNQQIINVKFVKVEAKLREQSRIRLEFGAFTAPTESIIDYPKAYIETDTSGAFTLKLPQNLITRLLARKITDDKVWNIDNNKQVGDLLKNAVSRGQEIIDAKFLQANYGSERKPSLSLKFSPPTDITIREDKKIIREEKKRRKAKKKSNLRKLDNKE